MVIKRKTIHLKGAIPNLGTISFQKLQMVIDPPNPFCLVRYAVHGQTQALGLRVDLDKQCFLDIIDESGRNTYDEAAREKLNLTARQIVEYLSKRRTKRK